MAFLATAVAGLILLLMSPCGCDRSPVAPGGSLQTPSVRVEIVAAPSVRGVVVVREADDAGPFAPGDQALRIHVHEQADGVWRATCARNGVAALALAIEGTSFVPARDESTRFWVCFNRVNYSVCFIGTDAEYLEIQKNNDYWFDLLQAIETDG